MMVPSARPATIATAAAAAGFLLAAVLAATPARAAEIRVDHEHDEMLDNGMCSLREAVVAANTNTQVDTCPAGSATDVDRVVIPGGTYFLLISSPSEENNALQGDLDLNGDIQLVGAGLSRTIIDAAGTDRVLDVIGTTSAWVSRVRLTGGDGAFGGAIRIRATSNVTLSRTKIKENSANTGGAIYSDSTGVVVVENSVVADNRATGGRGGGIYNLGPDVTLSRTTVRDNLSTSATANGGGGIWNDGSIRLVRSLVTGNRVPSGGAAGISNIENLEIDRSTISKNRSNQPGAGIYNTDDATITNSTISGNTTTFNAGGGIKNIGGELIVESTTITRNESTNGGAGGLSNDAGTVDLRNSLISGNEAPADADCSGTINSRGHNLVNKANSCNGFVRSDVLGKVANLRRLRDYGGPTPTHALKGSSPAINRGDPDEPGSSASACDETDQRGAPRRGRCDIGAYELVKCARRAVDHVGTPGNDSLTGTARADVFLLRGGTDVAHGGRGDDRMCGGGGRDRLFGEAGDDVLDGGSQNDTCAGGPGSDKLSSCEN